MLMLHPIIASVLTVGCVRSLYVPVERFDDNGDTEFQLSPPGLQSLLNERRNEQNDMMRELFLETLLRDHLVRRLKNDYSARRDGQNEMMMDLLRQSVANDEKMTKPIMWLRQSPAATTPRPIVTGPTPKDEMPNIIEKQLEFALGSKTSALYDKPYIQKKGDREFLVLNPGELDPFISVIPNDIYYSIQKTCVNWLDDCSEQGIRPKLFRLIKSPFL